MEITFGQYALPVVLMVILGIVFKFAGENIGDRWKALIAIVLGIALGILGIFYAQVEPRTVAVYVDYGLYGLMSGAAAVGLYEVQRTVTNPRS